ncbi:hypothetical protein VSDG_09198 [Cytospora chrysosperma]|uniref:Pyrroloquinoline quinone-dependent pyranose dehydrogenase beta-propeller domain-containing protein n=1 Tax=Cytospora chrysosperma TaxID=252740 RepID=A0A423VAQ4_CYTCH|nr:hypothetical protein VSDG_09198 [Valsa sordida]
MPSHDIGWAAQLVANGFTKPRTLAFDSSGALLVLDSGVGVKRLTFTDHGGSCLIPDTPVLVVNATSTIYASNAESVFAWPYNSSSGTVSGTNTTVVSGMANNDQVTRTLLMSQKEPGMLVVSRGSGESSGVDTLSSGLGQVKAFDLSDTPSQPYDFDTNGRLLGWGLYNAVGLGEHPNTGGIFSMDNGADDVTRDGVDVHQTNPGDEMNFHGFLNNTTTLPSDQEQGSNYGYPDCYAVWNTSIPDAPAGLKVGEQFSVVNNSTLNDTACRTDYVAPRLTFTPHQAPLDIVFAPDGTAAYITSHGSTDKINPVGYLIGQVSFDAATGMPTEPSDSTTAMVDIIRNTDDSSCPSSCLRPVGLAIDRQGRLFFSSDSTGEIYVLVKSSSTRSSSSPTGTGTMVMPKSTKKSDAEKLGAWMGAVLVSMAALSLVM